MIQEIFIQFLLGLSFLLLSVVIFTFPGTAFLKFVKLNGLTFLEKLTISSVVGLVLFTLFAYVLAFLHLRFLIWLYIIGGLIAGYLYYKEYLKFTLAKVKGLAVYFLIVLIIGVIGQLAVTAPSGFPYKDGYYYYSSHGHDGIWHIAVMEEMHKNVFPFQNPELANNKLQNYHFFVDLLMSEVTRVFPYSNQDVYFRFFPLIFSILLGLTSFVFVRRWSKSNLAGIWAMIFSYFCGSFGYLLTFPKYHNFNGETVFWVSQPHSTIGNPPHASAFVILIAFLFCLYNYLGSRSKSFLILCILLGGLVIEFKVYAGLLVLGGLFVITIWEILFRRRFKTLLLFLGTLIVALVIYLPNSASSQDFLLWQPWWPIRTMIVATDRLDWLDLELRRQTYIAEHNWKRVIQLELTGFLIFMFGNLGMRFLGFWTIFKKIKQNIFKDSFSIFYISILAASLFIPILFVQKGVAWNVIQFNQYFLLLFGLIGAISTAEIISLFKFKGLKIVISLLVILLSIPTQVGLLWQFYKNLPLSKVSYEEVEALENLRKISGEDAIILTAPFYKYVDQRYQPPKPIHSWYETGYVPAFSGRRTLISDTEQLNIMGYDISELESDRLKVFENPDPEKPKDPYPRVANEFFKKYNVDYVYMSWEQQLAAPIDSELDLELVYDNKIAKIYKVKKQIQEN